MYLRMVNVGYMTVVTLVDSPERNTAKLWDGNAEPNPEVYNTYILYMCA
jgi:hypothetical protein